MEHIVEWLIGIAKAMHLTVLVAARIKLHDNNEKLFGSDFLGDNLPHVFINTHSFHGSRKKHD